MVLLTGYGSTYNKILPEASVVRLLTIERLQGIDGKTYSL